MNSHEKVQIIAILAGAIGVLAWAEIMIKAGIWIAAWRILVIAALLMSLYYGGKEK